MIRDGKMALRAMGQGGVEDGQVGIGTDPEAFSRQIADLVNRELAELENGQQDDKQQRLLRQLEDLESKLASGNK